MLTVADPASGIGEAYLPGFEFAGGTGILGPATEATGPLAEHGALDAGGSEPRQSVLITGASSGIGPIGIQIAKAPGPAIVIAATRTAAMKDRLVATLTDQALPAVGAGRVGPVIETVLPFARATKAADRLRSGQCHDEIVLTMPRSPPVPAHLPRATAGRGCRAPPWGVFRPFPSAKKISRRAYPGAPRSWSTCHVIAS